MLYANFQINDGEFKVSDAIYKLDYSNPSMGYFNKADTGELQKVYFIYSTIAFDKLDLVAKSF